MSEHSAPSGATEDGEPRLSPAEQFEAWIAGRAAAPPALPPAPPTVPPAAPPAAPVGGGFGPSDGGWPLPSPAAPNTGGRRSVGLVLATVAAVALGSFGFAAGFAYHRAEKAGAAPTSSGGPNFGVQGGGLNPFGSGASGSSGGGLGNGFGNGFGSGALGGSSGSLGPAPTDEAASAIAAGVDPGIVDINTQIDFGSAAGAGTGMVLSSDGLILTNNHVVDGATDITVTTVENGHRYPATVVGTDPTEDIAVLQLKGASGLTTIPLGDSSQVAVGDPIVALGNAGGVGGRPVVATGIVEATGQTITASDDDGSNAETLDGLIEVNAPIQPGDSGGPLVNSAGKVIGIDTAAEVGGRGWRMRNSTTGTGYAIPINHALDIAHQIEQGQASDTIHLGTTGFLGVAVDSGADGVVVEAVEPDSPAERAGLAAGDTIDAVDGQAVDSPDTLSTLTKAHHAGDSVTVSWTDQNGKSHTTKVALAAGAPD
jgi:S1-C subfamily serine protease